MSTPTVIHDTFTLERTYPVSAARVYRALTDPAAKARWFMAPEGWTTANSHLESRVGGTEHAESTDDAGVTHVYDAIYHELLEDQQVIFSYVMHLGEQRVSASLTTIELTPVMTDPSALHRAGAFLDGDAAAGRDGSRTPSCCWRTSATPSP